MDLGQRNKISPTGNMSSMTDLVFLLLIFFIILSTMVVNGEKVNLPSTSTGEPVPSKVTLTVTSDLRYLINKTEVEKDRIEVRLKALMGSDPDEKRSLVLNVDRDVPTGETVELLGIAKVNGWKVVVATENRKQ